MGFSLSSRNLERLLIVMIGFCIVSFAYYFTNADIEEVQARFSTEGPFFLNPLPGKLVKLSVADVN